MILQGSLAFAHEARQLSMLRRPWPREYPLHTLFTRRTTFGSDEFVAPWEQYIFMLEPDDTCVGRHDTGQQAELTGIQARKNSGIICIMWEKRYIPPLPQSPPSLSCSSTPARRSHYLRMPRQFPKSSTALAGSCQSWTIVELAVLDDLQTLQNFLRPSQLQSV